MPASSGVRGGCCFLKTVDQTFVPVRSWGGTLTVFRQPDLLNASTAQIRLGWGTCSGVGLVGVARC